MSEIKDLTWADALRDAEALVKEAEGELVLAKRKVWRLKVAVRICRDYVEIGEPFPCKLSEKP